jgi:hypothetical protein
MIALLLLLLLFSILWSFLKVVFLCLPELWHIAFYFSKCRILTAKNHPDFSCSNILMGEKLIFHKGDIAMSSRNEFSPKKSTTRH